MFPVSKYFIQQFGNILVLFGLQDFDNIPVACLFSVSSVVLVFLMFTMNLRVTVKVGIVIQNCQLNPGSIG